MPKWLGNLLESAVGPKMTVSSVLNITPVIKKIRFTGDILKINFIVGGASVIRVNDTEYRNYTVSDHNIEKGYFEIVFHIHGNGPGSNYVNNLKEGDQLYISIPRGRKQYEHNDKTYVFFGDETSLGCACSFYKKFKQHNQHFIFIFELEEINKNAPLLLGLENVTTLIKNEQQLDRRIIVQNALSKLAAAQPANFIITGNAHSVQEIRQLSKNSTHSKIFAQGYWLEGKKGL